MYLRQHTATQVQVGPFLSSTDGNTERTALTLTASTAFFMKLGAAPALGTSTATLAGGTLGWYTLSLASSNVDTVGRLRLYMHSATELPVWHDWTVLPQQVYDSWITATDNLQVDLIQINGTVVTATGSVLGANITSINGNTVTATGSLFPADVIQWTHQTVATATGTLPDVNSQQVSHAAPQTATQIAAAVWDKVATDHQTDGTFGRTVGAATATGAISIFGLNSLYLNSAVGDVATDVWNYVVEGTITTVQSMRLMNGVLGGDSTGLDTNTPIYKSMDGTKNRWEGQANSGNRTVSNRDLT